MKMSECNVVLCEGVIPQQLQMLAAALVPLFLRITCLLILLGFFNLLLPQFLGFPYWCWVGKCINVRRSRYIFSVFLYLGIVYQPFLLDKNGTYCGSDANFIDWCNSTVWFVPLFTVAMVVVFLFHYSLSGQSLKIICLKLIGLMISRCGVS